MSENQAKPTRTFQAEKLTVQVYGTQQAMAVDAASQVHAYLNQTLRRQGSARAIFASAASQVLFLQALTGMPDLDWAKITLFHMDEYLGIDDQHQASFRRFMRERMQDVVHPAAYHYLQGDALEPLLECERYGSLLNERPIDLCCIGIGENGHIAFNDPAVANFEDRHTVKLVKLDEACRRQQVGEGAFPDLASVPPYAFSLTIPALLRANKVLCIVPERRKAQAVAQTLRGPIAPDCPASILRRQTHATLFLDAESASLL